MSIKDKVLPKDQEMAQKLHNFNMYCLERSTLEVKYGNQSEGTKWAVEYLKGARDLDELIQEAKKVEIAYTNLERLLKEREQKRAYR